MFIKDGQPFALQNGMIIDDVQIVLPLSDERMAELGITEVADGPRPDDRFYDVGPQRLDGTYPATPKDRSIPNETVWSYVKTKRDSVKSGGVLVEGKWFHTDDASRIQHMALTMMGVGIPANLQWKTMDGSFIVMSQALAGKIFQAVAALDMQAFAAAETHRAALLAAANPFEYDFSAGWPQTYAEFVAAQE